MIKCNSKLSCLTNIKSIEMTLENDQVISSNFVNRLDVQENITGSDVHEIFIHPFLCTMDSDIYDISEQNLIITQVRIISSCFDVLEEKNNSEMIYEKKGSFRIETLNLNFDPDTSNLMDFELVSIRKS